MIPSMSEKEVNPLGIKVTLIGLSGFRTEWGNSSMKAVEQIEDYQATVGRMASYIREHTGKEKM